MHVECVCVVEVITVFGLLSEVLGIIVSVNSAIVAFLSTVELVTVVFFDYCTTNS